MNMKTVSVTEANQRFSYLIREVEEDGIEIHILRRDRPVAVLLPERKYNIVTQSRRDEAIAEMKRIIRKGFHLGNEPFDREAAHERT